MKYKVLFCTMPLMLAAPTYANESDDSADETMIISASRVDTKLKDSSQTVTIITKQQVEQQRQLTSDTSQIISNLIPSFNPSRQKMSGSGETLRGRIPLVMIDGIPQSNPLRPTGREMHTIDAAMIERIEVIRGANTSNGIGAAGGVINIITKRPSPGAFNQHLSVEATAPTSRPRAEDMNYKTSYSVNGAEDRLDYLFALSYEDQGLYKDANNRAIGVDNTQGDLMDSRAYDLLGKVGYWIDDYQRVQFSVNHYQIKNKNNYVSVRGDRNLGIPTTSERGRPEGSAPHNSVWTLGATYDNDDLAGMKFHSLAFYQNYEALFGATNSGTFQDPNIAPVGTLYDQSRAYTTKFGTKMALTKDDLWDDSLKVTVGFDTLFDNSKQDLWGTGRTYVPTVNYTDLSPFAQVDVKPIDSLTLTGGVRYEYAELNIDGYRVLSSNGGYEVEGGKPHFTETLYNLGAVWTPVEPFSLFTNYSEGFSVPDVGRVLRTINQPNMSVDNFLSLKPIITKNSEVGFRIQQQPFDFELSYYRSTSKLGNRVERSGDIFVARRERTEIDGVEATLGYAINQQNKLNLSYSHMRGRYDSDNDGKLDSKLNGLNVAPDRIIASLASDWTPKLSTFVQANWAIGKSFDDQEMNFSGYALVDGMVAYQLPQGKVSLGISNLLNKQYITYYSQSALIEPDRYFAGRGRTVSLGYQVDF